MADTAERFDILDPFAAASIPLADWADGIKGWAIQNREAIKPFREGLDWLIQTLEGALQGTPPLVMLILLALLAWQAAGGRTALLVLALLGFLGFLAPNAWDLAMTTLAIVLTSVIVCVVIGLPLGIAAGKSDTLEAVLRPLLDTMQTIPAFVYLVPVVMLIGIGNVPGVVVTVVFAIPPLIRLTALAIRQVDGSVVEAARAFGANPRQILLDVELPLATRTIMAGLNQTIMMSLSMVVIASMIAVKGFGNEVLRAIGRLDAGKAIVGGLGIVILAVVLDRITQGVARSGRERGHRRWYESGPAGLVHRLFERRATGAAGARVATRPAADDDDTALLGESGAAPRFVTRDSGSG